MSDPPEDDEPSDASPVEGPTGDTDDDATREEDDSAPAPGDDFSLPPEGGDRTRETPGSSLPSERDGGSDPPHERGGSDPPHERGGADPPHERGGADPPHERGGADPPRAEPSGRGANRRGPGTDADTGPDTHPPGNVNARQSSGAERRDAPAPRHADQSEDDDVDNWVVTFLVDVGSSALAVLLVGFFLFTVSGVWPPMVAVESASMTPNMETGDLVFVMEEDRFPDGAAQGDTGVVTAREGAETGYSTFDEPGDVIVFEPDGNDRRTPIIHRAMFWVEEGERWYDRADKGAVGSASNCEELTNCPAPTDGFITKGDANPTYDQVGANPHSDPVKPEWVVGTAEVRVPKLGCIRLPAERCGDVLQTSLLGDDLRTVAAFDSERLEAVSADLLNATG
jgi:signal peptidase